MNDLQQLAPGVFAYIQADGSWFINNTGLIHADDAVVCIDTCATEDRTRRFLQAVLDRTERPVSALVNTHHHPDHTNGNGLLGASTIIAHTVCRQELARITGPPPAGVFDPVQWGRIEPQLPNVCFDSRLELHTPKHRIELLHFGTPAHTTNDIVAWLPEQRVLFAGDLAFNRGTPFALSGSISGWLDVLDELEALRPDIVVPGHGPVGGREILCHTADYLAFVRDIAPAAHARQLTALQAAHEIELGPYCTLTDSERIVGNLERAFAELRGLQRGSPIDHAATFAEMVTFNGGKPLRCLA